MCTSALSALSAHTLVPRIASTELTHTPLLLPRRIGTLAAALAEDERSSETIGPAARLAEVLREQEPEFHPLDVCCAEAQTCWSLAPSPALSMANAAIFERIAAIMRDHPTVGLHVRAVVSGAECAMPAAIASHFTVDAKGSAIALSLIHI